MRGDRLGLIGPNGAGKTTLLKLILGTMAPDTGTIRLGTKLQVAYFDQMRAQLDDERTLAETISPGADWIETADGRKHVLSYLGEFLFPPQRANAPVKTLSGGERNRLLLARLFAQPANLSCSTSRPTISTSSRSKSWRRRCRRTRARCSSSATTARSSTTS